jgi:hypothetical protein
MNRRELRRVFSGILRFVRDVLLVELVLLLIAAVIWVATGGSSLAEYARTVTCSGGVAIFLGAIGLRGGMSAARDAMFQMSESTTEATVSERGRRRLEQTYRGGGFLLLMTVVGLVAVILGLVLSPLAGNPLWP